MKPVNYLMENIESTEVPEKILSRFQKIFDQLNERKSAVPDKVHGTTIPPSKG